MDSSSSSPQNGHDRRDTLSPWISTNIDVKLPAGPAPPALALAVLPELDDLAPSMRRRVGRREVEPQPAGECESFTHVDRRRAVERVYAIDPHRTGHEGIPWSRPQELSPLARPRRRAAKHGLWRCTYVPG